MNETCQNAEKFLSDLMEDMRFDLRVSAEWTDEGCLLNLSGEDAHYALAENGEMLSRFCCSRSSVANWTANTVSSSMPRVSARPGKPSFMRWRVLPPTRSVKTAGRLHLEF